MDPRPEIALNLDIEAGVIPRSYLRHTYYDAVWGAGGWPVLLPPIVDEAYVDDALARVGALVLTGGDDLDPALYGAEKHPSVTLMHPRRQAFDLLLTRRALARGVPILGICGGLQTLNVVLGGDLLQDIPTQHQCPLVHHSHDPQAPAEHEVRVEPGSALGRVLGAERVLANSCHHQSIGRLGAGLRAVAFSPDGVIEAVELDDAPRGPVIAVQWHPERITARDPHGRLFRDIVARARERSH
jgi:putative glutamine amidotransferase